MRMAELGIYPAEFAGQPRSVGTRNILVHEYDKVDYQKNLQFSLGLSADYYHQYCEYIS